MYPYITIDRALTRFTDMILDGVSKERAMQIELLFLRKEDQEEFKNLAEMTYLIYSVFH